MPRLMSCSMTKDAVIARTKTVTRRGGWWLDKNGNPIVKVGDRLTLVEKAMGLRKGEKVVRLAEVEVVSVRREPLSDLIFCHDDYPEREMEREGFPGMEPYDFIETYFVRAQGMTHDTEVTRIEWRYLNEGSTTA